VQNKNIGADKISSSTKYWRRQNIGVDQILVSTKYWCRQNTRVDEMLASTKYLHQQNTRVNKMLKKYLRQKNVGASAEESLYCSGPAESAAADFSQTSLIFSLKVLSSPGAVAQ
jgi:hypothetical protein